MATDRTRAAPEESSAFINIPLEEITGLTNRFETISSIDADLQAAPTACRQDPRRQVKSALSGLSPCVLNADNADSVKLGERRGGQPHAQNVTICLGGE